MAWILLPVALAAGVVLAVQFGVNSQLRTFVGGPLAADAVALAVAALAVQRSLPGSVDAFAHYSPPSTIKWIDKEET